MPSGLTGKRRVRCPKCTALLTEPQTPIYECPICSTYLLAKGNAVSKTSDKRLLVGDAEEAQKTTDGGGKREKAILSNIDEPLRIESVGIEKIRESKRESAIQSDIQSLSDPGDQNDPKHSLPKNDHVTSESFSGSHSEKLGDITDHASIDHSSDLDLGSHSESEADAALWSPENANASESTVVSPVEQSSEGSSSVYNSSEVISTLSSRGLEQPAEVNNSRKDGENVDKQQSFLQDEHTSEREPENKEANGADIATANDTDRKTTSKSGSETMQSGIAKGPAEGGDIPGIDEYKEKAIKGKFQLFDLSVFGINEETYNELRRGKIALYPALAESSVDGDAIDQPEGNESSSQLSSNAPQNMSLDKDCSLAASPKSVLAPEKNNDSLKSVALEAGSIIPGNGDSNAAQIIPEHENNMSRSSCSSVRETENVGVAGVNDVESLATERDVDALVRARYGDDLSLRELSADSASVDISFGDWRSLTASKTILKKLEVDAEHDMGERNLAEGDTDSSWDDDEELTFVSPEKGGSKLEAISAVNSPHGSPVNKDGNDAPQARNSADQPAFPLRTSAMQKLLKRDHQQDASQTQSSDSVAKSVSVHYEAPYMEHYSPLPISVSQETPARAPPIILPVQISPNAPPMAELKPQSVATESDRAENEMEHAENKIELQRRSVPSSQTSSSVNMEKADLITSEFGEEDRRQVLNTDNLDSTKAFKLPASSQEDGILEKMDSTGLEKVALASKKLDSNRVHQDTQETQAGAPVSLKWDVKGRSTPSLSSTEDEGAYGMESEAGSGPEKDPFREKSLGWIGRPFPAKKGIDGSGQQSRDPGGRVSQRTWGGSNEGNRRKLGSGEVATSRRTARSRPSNEKLSNQGPFMGQDRVYVEAKGFDYESSEWTGLGSRAEQLPAYLGSGSSLNRGGPDKMLNFSPSGTVLTDYNSDQSSRSQDVLSHSHHVDYLSNSQIPGSNASVMTYPCQLPPYGSAAFMASHGEGVSHPSHAHHGISAACSVCIQQQYLVQHAQMHQNAISHQCATCAVQASAAHQHLHHEIHGHHIHGLTHTNHTLRHHDTSVSPAQSSRQHRSRVQHDDLNVSSRRKKHYTPLPGKGAPPLVLCRHCDQILRVPEYLPPIRRSVQRLHCGACGKISKFSISAPWSPAKSPDQNDFVEKDNLHIKTTNVFSSGQSSSPGVVSPTHSAFGKLRLNPGPGAQQAWIENRATSHSNAHQVPQPNLAGHHNRIKPLSVGNGSRQGAYGSRYMNGKHASNDTGALSDDYSSSSPSSGSVASPQSPIRAAGRFARDQKLRPDLPSLRSVQGKGRYAQEQEFFDVPPQKGVGEHRSRVSQISTQGSAPESFGDSPRYAHLGRYDNVPRTGGWENEPADGNYSGRNSPRSHLDQAWKLPAAPGSHLDQAWKLPPAPGSPLAEQVSHFKGDDLFPAQQRQIQNSFGKSSRSAPRSPKSESQASPPYDPYSYPDTGGRSSEKDHALLPLQETSKGHKSFAGLLKRSIKDLGKGAQGGGSRRKVIVNGYLISEAAVRKAEEQAGPIYSGTYWYDYQAGFWGVLGGPCLGILMPFIEDFKFPLARDCAGGRTGILVNGRELHDKDLEVLAKRGLPTTSGKAYVLDINGVLLDDVTGQSLKGLGKLAPSIERRGRGCGMSPSNPLS